MTNFSWYLCLSIISAGIAGCTIYIKRDTYKVSTLLVFYLFVSANTWIGEFIVLGFFNAYAYKTGLFEDIWAQNLLGHLLLNTTMFPAAAIVMVAYSFRYRYISLVAVLFVLIEYFFMKLGIYEQHWWRYYMSTINVVAFLLLSKMWFPKMYHRCHGSTRAITFYFVALIIIHTPTPLLLLLGKQHYHITLIDNLVSNFYLSSINFSFIYDLVKSFVLVLCVCILKKWYWKALLFLLPPVVQYLFNKIGILIIQDSWSLIYTVVIFEISIALFILIEKYTLKPEIHRPERNETDSRNPG